MPVPLALPLGLATGAALAWLDGAGREGDQGRKAALLFGGLVLGPAAAYLEAVANPWANLYAFDLPSAVDLTLVLLVAASPLFGERIARRGLDRGDPRWPLGLAAFMLTAFAAGAALCLERIEVVASFGAFHRGLGGESLWRHPAGAALIGATIATGTGFALAARGVTERR